MLASPSAGAHALLVSSDPSDGVSLPRSPAVATLEFTEEPDPDLSSIRVLDESGGSHERGLPQSPSGDPRALRVGVEELSKGVYTVSWRVVSRVDGHLTSGAFAFGVAVTTGEIEDAETAEAAAPPVSAGESAGRFLLYAGLAGAVGAAWVGGVLFQAERRSMARMLAASAGAAVVGLLLLGLAQRSAADARWGAFLSSPIGRALVGRGLFVVVLVSSAIWLLSASRRDGRAAWITAMVAGVATIAVHASAGHAGTGPYSSVKVATQLVHFAAMAVWIGGLAGVLVALRSAGPTERGHAVRRFSAVAGIALLVVVGTGTARAVAEIGSWSALVQTGYGRLVVAKVALLAVLALLGARNRWWNVPKASETVSPLRRISRIEVGIAGAVLALAAVLSSLVPGRTALLARPASITLEATDFARTVRVGLEITPGLPGGNLFVADVETLRGSRRVDGVRLRLSSQSAEIDGVNVRLRRSGDGWTARSAAAGVQGVWRAVVLVGRGVDSAEVPFTFHTRCRAEVAAAEARPRIFDIEAGEDRSVQAYVDPARPGRNEVHFTFFDAQGKELPMADDPQIQAFLESSRRLDVRRFSPGHFVAGGRFGDGAWTFDFAGETSTGDLLTVCFSDEIR